MDNPLKTPEQILPYRSLMQILGARKGVVHAARPGDSALDALKSMADKAIGLLVVMEDHRLVGVLSERDFGRKVVLAGRTVRDTRVDEIMTREVVTVTPAQRFGDCLQLMDRHGIRHLPVVDAGRVIGVISVRDLMGEAVAHHEKVIRALELERLSMFTSSH